MTQNSDKPTSSGNNKNTIIGGLVLMVIVIGIFGLWQSASANTNGSELNLELLESALDRARNFTGTLNGLWEPFAHDFGDGTEMMLVPVGCFMMGSDGGNDNEQPVHEQCIEEPFWIDRYEVTNAQYGSIGCEQWSSEPNQPRNCVDWFDALEYCQAHGGSLPTERQWEYAARGVESWVYPWGDEFIGNNAVWRNNSNNRTANVASHSNGASWVGALDMSGNLDEWTSTIYEDYPYNANDGREDLNRTDELRVLRSGSFNIAASNLRAAGRSRDYPNSVYVFNGFRCIRPVD